MVGTPPDGGVPIDSLKRKGTVRVRGSCCQIFFRATHENEYWHWSGNALAQ
jgi:hypothetical protein